MAPAGRGRIQVVTPDGRSYAVPLRIGATTIGRSEGNDSYSMKAKSLSPCAH